MAPFEEDVMVCGLAESLGLELSRRFGIVVTDEKLVKAAGLMRESPVTADPQVAGRGAAVEAWSGAWRAFSGGRNAVSKP
jgi:hypothetical protein